MHKVKPHSPKRLITSILVIILVAALTVSLALLGYHLASRYRDTITDAVNGITNKLSDFEQDIFPPSETSEPYSQK